MIPPADGTQGLPGSGDGVQAVSHGLLHPLPVLSILGVDPDFQFVGMLAVSALVNHSDAADEAGRVQGLSDQAQEQVLPHEVENIGLEVCTIARK